MPPEVIDLTLDKKLPAIPSTHDVLASWDADSSSDSDHDPVSDYARRILTSSAPPLAQPLPNHVLSATRLPASPKCPHPPSDPDSDSDPNLSDAPMEPASHNDDNSNASTTLERSPSLTASDASDAPQSENAPPSYASTSSLQT